MNNQEINIAIAEACGWTRQRSSLQSKDDPEPRGWVSPKGKGNYWKTVDRVPDYCNDLNAMHEAEKVLTLDSGQYNAYENQLRMLLRVSGRKVANATEEHKFLTAAAHQRAEAFLKTLGLWKEEV